MRMDQAQQLFRRSAVTGGLDEFCELPVGNRRWIDVIAIEENAVNRFFHFAAFLATHQKIACGYEYHFFRTYLLAGARIEHSTCFHCSSSPCVLLVRY